MITFDFECKEKHRFEGSFKDHSSYEDQMSKKMVQCPFCNTTDLKRIYTGCSIQSKKSLQPKMNKDVPNLFSQIRKINEFIKKNSEYVGDNFYDVARSIHYGQEEERSIYGESKPEEIKELLDEGIKITPLINVDKMEN